jgi:hypothetical protein
LAGETDVVNVALRLVGASPITSLGDGTPSANTADDIYTEVRDDLLRSHPWNFATKRQKLAQSATAPVFEFDHAYPLPAAWLRTLSVHDNDAGHGTILYRMEIVNNQRAIVTSSDEVWIRYIFRLTDPNVMSSDFRRALEVALARDLAVPLAASNTLQAALAEQAKLKLASARSSDAMGAFPELRPRGSWASSRGGRRRNEFLND